jgi:DNA-binding MarR family transcriptional regulator
MLCMQNGVHGIRPPAQDFEERALIVRRRHRRSRRARRIMYALVGEATWDADR